jgi:hypothetical protein
MNLNELAEHVYHIAAAHGFHENDDSPGRVAEFIANLHGEVSELWEAYRMHELNHPCDKVAKMSEPLTCAEEELADIIIRALDTACTWNVDIDRAVRVKSEYNETRSYKHGGKAA